MTDAKMIWFDIGGDIILGGDKDLLHDNGLYTAVLISIFTDARAPLEAELPQDEIHRRGWWPDTQDNKIGSLLWLIEREKTTGNVADRAREYCEAALAWLIKEQIASRVQVEAELVRPLALKILIRIQRGNSRQYSYLWDAMLADQTIMVGNTSVTLKFE